MGTVRVISKRIPGVVVLADERVINVGRPSVLGNPYRMFNETQRATVIHQFRLVLNKSRIDRGSMWLEVERIAMLVRGGENVALCCWCAPKACHGDVIKQAIEQIL